MNTGWNDIVTRTFRGRFRQIRCFDVHEIQVIQIVADSARRLVANFHIVHHFVSSQIDVAVFHTQFIGYVQIAFDIERRRLRFRQNFHGFRFDFDCARADVRVDLVCFAKDHFTFDLQDIFPTDRFRNAEGFFAEFCIENDLDDAFAVTQVDKDQSA